MFSLIALLNVAPTTTFLPHTSTLLKNSNPTQNTWGQCVLTVIIRLYWKLVIPANCHLGLTPVMSTALRYFLFRLFCFCLFVYQLWLLQLLMELMEPQGINRNIAIIGIDLVKVRQNDGSPQQMGDILWSWKIEGTWQFQDFSPRSCMKFPPVSNALSSSLSLRNPLPWVWMIGLPLWHL